MTDPTASQAALAILANLRTAMDALHHHGRLLNDEQLDTLIDAVAQVDDRLCRLYLAATKPCYAEPT